MNDVAALRAAVAAAGRTIRIMEVCGTHTVAIFRSGVRSLLPAGLDLISGPGCPVCVTAQGYIDVACDLARQAGVVVCTYGDLVRVPGRGGSLAEARAAGGRVEVVYGARQALDHARAHPDRQVVFLAVGFETTAPATALAVLEAARDGLGNFSVLTAHKLVVPALAALLAGGGVTLDGLLCPGHVSVVIGAEAYRPLVERHRLPCIVAGFEPASLIDGLTRLCQAVVDGRPVLGNAYAGVARPAGNEQAQAVLARVFRPAAAVWRAMGCIPGSGLELAPEFAGFDARTRFGLVGVDADHHPPGCRCGEVIQGRATPAQCGLFATVCTPATPVGPCMVSGEGTCAAYHRYARRSAP